MFIHKAIHPDPREDKLPVWAREAISGLRRCAMDAMTELAHLKSGTVPSPFYLQAWDGDGRYYLPRESGRLMFSGEDREPLQLLLPQQESDKGWLTISGGTHGLIIKPVASNVLKVRNQPD